MNRVLATNCRELTFERFDVQKKQSGDRVSLKNQHNGTALNAKRQADIQKMLNESDK
jgi:hypothetical protein